MLCMHLVCTYRFSDSITASLDSLDAWCEWAFSGNVDSYSAAGGGVVNCCVFKFVGYYRIGPLVPKWAAWRNCIEGVGKFKRRTVVFALFVVLPRSGMLFNVSVALSVFIGTWYVGKSECSDTHALLSSNGSHGHVVFNGNAPAGCNSVVHEQQIFANPAREDHDGNYDVAIVSVFVT